MSTRTLPGSFPQTDGPLPVGSNSKVVFQEQIPNGPTRSIGAIRVSPITVHPQQGNQWKVLGFSARTRLCFMPFTRVSNVDPNPFGRLGDVWLGLLIDSNQQDTYTNVALPANATTFAKLFDGDTDSIAQYPQSFASGVSAQAPFGTPSALTFMFPTPIELAPGTDLRMALIALPSLVFQAELIVVSVDYTLIYDEQ